MAESDPAAAAMLAIGLAVVCALGACGKPSDPLPAAAGYGPRPFLPAPHHRSVPTIKIARPRGWGPGQTPTAAPGLAVAAFASGLDHPRWLYVLPNGDVLVAETNSPGETPHDLKSALIGAVAKVLQTGSGAATPSPDRIILLRDTNGDGVADVRGIFLRGLHSPFGMALVGGDLYVADTDALLRFAYRAGQTHIDAPPVKLADLPAGPINHHWTKNAIASRDGSRLYVTVGSNSNVGDNGMDKEVGRAAIYEVERASGRMRLFATGLRNPNGMDWEPRTGALWTAVNERDEIGDDLVPDYMTSVRDGAFYGWPYSYFGQHVDKRAKPPRPDLVARATVPDYALGAHTASLGLMFNHGMALMPEAFAEGAFVGQHGSWNRSQFSGYQVIFVPFSAGRPAGPPRPVLTGFLDAAGQARGRPVGVAAGRDGALLVADDLGGVVWRARASGAR